MIMRFAFFALVALIGCSSNEIASDAGSDAPAACIEPSTDASFTCDVSSIPSDERGCKTWTGAASSSDGGTSCPAAPGWATQAGASCTYQWAKSGPADLCQLPSQDGIVAFEWLHPTCIDPCDASFDVGPPTACATSADCPVDTYYCEKNGDCGGPGTCLPVSGGTGPAGQVCACDGVTYPSATAAHADGESVAFAGSCE